MYDSDEDDEDMNLCDDGHSMTSEQRKVLNFYNEGSDQELATIQVNTDTVNSDTWEMKYYVTIIDSQCIQAETVLKLKFVATTIQGCSKKKVENIKELRPFIGWGDLVRKMQLSKNLSADMLNETTKLLRMRDTVSKLMDKVCREQGGRSGLRTLLVHFSALTD